MLAAHFTLYLQLTAASTDVCFGLGVMVWPLSESLGYPVGEKCVFQMGRWQEDLTGHDNFFVDITLLPCQPAVQKTGFKADAEEEHKSCNIQTSGGFNLLQKFMAFGTICCRRLMYEIQKSKSGEEAKGAKLRLFNYTV